MILGPKIVTLIQAQNPSDPDIELLSDGEASMLVHGFLATLSPEQSYDVSTADAVIHWAQMVRLQSTLLDLAVRGWINVGWSHEHQEVSFSLSEEGLNYHRSLMKDYN